MVWICVDRDVILCLQLQADQLLLEMEPHNIKSTNENPTQIFYFEGIPDVNLSNIAKPHLEALEKAIFEDKSARALWNEKVCGTLC